jgi:hypothetical protein
MTHPNPPYLRKIYFVNADEVLSGKVHGQSASDLEERSARALTRYEIPFSFRRRISPVEGLTGKKENLLGEVEIDFFTEFRSVIYPININGEIAHYYAAWQKEKDALKEIRINAALVPYRAQPLIIIPFTLLRTQEDTDRLFRWNFLNGWPMKFPQP